MREVKKVSDWCRYNDISYHRFESRNENCVYFNNRNKINTSNRKTRIESLA